jgi:hypothetical protein
MQKRLAATSNGTSNNKKKDREKNKGYLFIPHSTNVSTSHNLKIKLLAPDNEFTSLQ